MSCRRRARHREKSSGARGPPSLRGQAGRQAKLVALRWWAYGSFTGANLRLQPVEREVELEHVDPRLAQQTEGTSLDLTLHQGADARFRQAARLGNPRHLE